MDHAERAPHVTVALLDFVRLEVHHEALTPIRRADRPDHLWINACGLRINGNSCPELKWWKHTHHNAFDAGESKKCKYK